MKHPLSHMLSFCCLASSPSLLWCSRRLGSTESCQILVKHQKIQMACGGYISNSVSVLEMLPGPTVILLPTAIDPGSELGLPKCDEFNALTI
jgi:hypothetical protein